VQAWIFRGDANPHQNTNCVGSANEYIPAYGHAPTQLDAYSPANRRAHSDHAQSQPTSPERHATANGYAAGSFAQPHVLAT
jgi:hypothetical protein